MTSTIHLPSITRLPVRSIRRSLLLGLLLVGVAAALLAVGLGLAEAPVEGARAVSSPASTAASTPVPADRASCWVTGDLVGEGNPADLAAALCADK
jgi:hypothetical protein